ncbi:pentapeptide repeat-containing protein [Striga asiatica]|uniref:Pentapeptide repeat-containing protein n=1 Tax=Striga asiatica TaxID=4170 RepID=A0A5A7PSK8_STRAF|nr:pentapeptide repeat-containing protein [Striga asiatica]
MTRKCKYQLSRSRGATRANINVSSAGVEALRRANINVSSAGVETLVRANINVSSAGVEALRRANINVSSAGVEAQRRANINVSSAGVETLRRANINILSSPCHKITTKTFGVRLKIRQPKLEASTSEIKDVKVVDNQRVKIQAVDRSLSVPTIAVGDIGEAEAAALKSFCATRQSPEENEIGSQVYRISVYSEVCPSLRSVRDVNVNVNVSRGRYRRFVVKSILPGCDEIGLMAQRRNRPKITRSERPKSIQELAGPRGVMRSDLGEVNRKSKLEDGETSDNQVRLDLHSRFLIKMKKQKNPNSSKNKLAGEKFSADM